MTKVELDLDPKHVTSPGNGIEAKKVGKVLEKYIKYQYTKKSGGKVEITTFKYNKHKLPNLISINGIQVTKVITYFDKDSNKLLIIHVETNENHYYYTNVDANQQTSENTTFDSFVTVNKKALNEESEIKKILQKVESGKRFKPGEMDDLKGKLRDLSENLFINLDEAEKLSGTSGKYRSDEDKEIPVEKKNTTTGFSYTTHCFGLMDFTVANIKTETGDVRPGIIPKERIRTLKVFYMTNKPLLIYFQAIDLTETWICHYFGDTDWEDVNGRDGIPTNDTDNNKIKNLLDKIAIPNVDLDLSKSNSTYQPSKNNLFFKVSKTQNPPESGIFQFKHTGPENQVFKITALNHNHQLLDGIECDEDILSVSAYYDGDNPKRDQLMMVELECRNNMCMYFRRKNGQHIDIWIGIQDKENKLNNDQLKNQIDTLSKEYNKDIQTEVDDPGIATQFHNNGSEGTEDTHISISTLSSSSSSSSGVSGALIGGIIGGILGLAVFGFLAWKGVSRMRSRV